MIRVTTAFPRYRPGLVIPLFAALSMILLIAFAILARFASPVLIVIVIMIIGTIVACLALYHRMEQLRETAALAEELVARMSVTADSIRFPEPLEVQLGTLRGLGAWYHAGRGAHYESVIHFEPEGPEKRRDSIEIAELKKPFTVFTTYDADFVELPAARLIYKGRSLLLALADPSAVQFERDRISVSVRHEEEWATAYVELGPDRLRGRISRSTAGLARSARLELVGELEARLGRLSARLKAEVELARATGPMCAFERFLSPREPVLVVTSEVSDVGEITKAIIGSSYAVAGFSRGSYRLTLVLDLPLRPDVRASVELPVYKPGERAT